VAIDELFCDRHSLLLRDDREQVEFSNLAKNASTRQRGSVGERGDLEMRGQGKDGRSPQKVSSFGAIRSTLNFGAHCYML
jgi:hypothetical protein